jgi:hypothetical protein
MGHYDGDPWSSHQLNEIKCAECEEEFDQQEEEGGNICPSCIEKEGESDDVETISWSSSNPTGERGRE